MVELDDWCMATYKKHYHELCERRKRAAVICVQALNKDIKKRNK